MTTDDERYERGMALRREFVGPEVLDPLMDAIEDFDRPYHGWSPGPSGARFGTGSISTATSSSSSASC